jgi:hypothetical protein
MSNTTARSFENALRQEITEQPCLTFERLLRLVATHDVESLATVACEENYGRRLGARMPQPKDFSGFVGAVQEQRSLADSSIILLTVVVRIVNQMRGFNSGAWRESIAQVTEQLINIIEASSDVTDVHIALETCRRELALNRSL